MNRALLTLLALCFSAGALGASLDDCDEPTAPTGVPDGATASQEEMIEAQGAVKDFVADGQAYVGCVQEVIEEVEAEVKATMSEGSDEMTAAQQALARKHQKLIDLHNGMVEDMERVANEFNEALHAWNSQAD